jgi:hypothetical protein
MGQTGGVNAVLEIHTAICKHCAKDILKVQEGKWYHAELSERLTDALLDGGTQAEQLSYFLSIIGNPQTNLSSTTSPAVAGLVVPEEVLYDVAQVRSPNGHRSCKSAMFNDGDVDAWFAADPRPTAAPRMGTQSLLTS